MGDGGELLGGEPTISIGEYIFCSVRSLFHYNTLT